MIFGETCFRTFYWEILKMICDDRCYYEMLTIEDRNGRELKQITKRSREWKPASKTDKPVIKYFVFFE